MSGEAKSLQETYAPKSICFGCGPANDRGLKIRSFKSGEPVNVETYICDWAPDELHHAFPGVLNGGICGALLDCHSNWAACTFLMTTNGAAEPPCTVTADFAVKLKRPTPMRPLQIIARIVLAESDPAAGRAVVDAEIVSGGKVTATCRGTFVAVKEGHPAFHRW